MARLVALMAVAVLVPLLAAGPALAAAGGDTHNAIYVVRAPDPDLPGASVQLDTVLFTLTTVAGKYRIFVLRLEARDDRPDLALSRSADRVTVLLGDREVPALLDPASADPALWDGLDPTQRQALLYPGAIPAGTMRQLYLLVPAAEIGGVPSGFRLSIAALGRTLELRQAGPKAD
jgi:hypothetical protein